MTGRLGASCVSSMTASFRSYRPKLHSSNKKPKALVLLRTLSMTLVISEP
jgi:hypothetical protein